ncbi:MAG: FAD-dependent thymidylate synthase [Clostridia bacterium]|nr:FAD-dependent thymidylate synthase [Clostridia bacterium]
MSNTEFNTNSKAIIIGLTDTGEKIPAASGRISTQPGTALEILDLSKDPQKNANLISKVTRSGHNSTVEHTVFNLAFQNVSVLVEQFVIEFRLASFTVKSRRYVDFAKLGYYVPHFTSKAIHDKYMAHMNYLYKEYEYLIEKGIPKEDARFLLPYSLYSNFYCTLNAREMLNMLYAMIYGRGSEFAEIHTLGESLLEQARRLTPGIFTDFENRRPTVQDTPKFNYKPNAEYIKNQDAVELLSYTPDAAKAIARAALIENCNLPTMQIEEIIDNNDECAKIIKAVISSKRQRALEAATFTFRINNVSLSCLTHFARHRMQSIGIPSLTLTDRARHILPATIEKYPDLKERYCDAFVKTNELYNELKKAGVSEELLAYIQLSGNTVDIVTTINGRELLLFMKLRSCNRAQWEIRDFAIDMLKKLRAADSTVFNFYGPSCYVSKCPEGPLTCGKAAEVIEAIKNL